VRCVHLFNLMMDFLSACMGTTVILCTATQPLLGDVGRKILYGNPRDMIRDADQRAVDFKRVNISYAGRMNGDELCRYIRDELGQNLLVILNTKTAVRNVCEKLKGCLPPDVRLCELTTYMCPQHRSDAIDSLKRDIGTGRVICVSTQLIEAGVDISFQKVIRSLAGLDNVLQAAGRCNRSGEMDHCGEVRVVSFSEENVDMLPDIRIAQESMEWFLEAFGRDPCACDCDYLSRKSMNLYNQKYFYSRRNEMDYNVKELNTTIFSLLSANGKFADAYRGQSGKPYPWPMRQAFKEAGSRFEAIESKDTIGLIVPYEAAVADIAILQNSRDFAQLRRALRRLQRYTVNLYRDDKTLKRPLEQRAIYTLLNGDAFALAEAYYSERGVTDKMESEVYVSKYIL